MTLRGPAVGNACGSGSLRPPTLTSKCWITDALDRGQTGTGRWPYGAPVMYWACVSLGYFCGVAMALTVVLRAKHD